MVEKGINNSNIPTLPVNKINIGRWNVRTLDREKGVDELAESIEKYGLLQPIVVFQEGDRYNLIIGQRRVQAFKKLKKKEIPAVILPEKPDEEHLKILSLSENIHRVELNRADIVEVISYLYEKYNKSAKKVAQILGKSAPYIYEHLKIQNAPEEVKQMLSRKEISKEDVKRVMEIAADDKATMIELAREMKKLTPYERKRLADVVKIKPNAKVKELIEEAKNPRIEEKIIIPLTPKLLKALDSAVKEIGLSREEIAKKALEDWLGNKGYYKG
ncbi:MAG: ParB/RepB/Spo0J family partition protein [Thermodesulfobacteriota bacterium]